MANKKTQKTRARGNGSGSIFRRQGSSVYQLSWYDENGRRQERSSKTTDKRSAERILSKLLDDVALRREGVIDPAHDRWATQAKRPVRDMIEDYIQHCQISGMNEHHTKQKKARLLELVDNTQIQTFGELRADVLEQQLQMLKRSGRSARTINFHRQVAVAFYQWAVKEQRAKHNPLTSVIKHNEQADRRRVRRPLTHDELTRLLKVADERGRGLWYRLAFYAGLRRGDLKRLKWCDIDLDANVVSISQGKAKRTDLLPIHPQLKQVLEAESASRLPHPSAIVFPQAVTSRTQAKDFYRAGLAKRYSHTYINCHGEEVHEYRYDLIGEDGKAVDLHALRTTLATELARQGTAPQVAQKIMRHADYKTTQAAYTVLGLDDTARAMGQISLKEAPEKHAAG